MMRILGWRSILGVTALLLTGAAAARAQGDTRPTLAVMTFTNGALGAAHGDLEPLTVGMAALLIDALAMNQKIRVVERGNLDALMKEQNLDTSGRVDPSTAARLGRILGAGHMIYGGFVTDTKGTMRIVAYSVNSETSAVEGGQSWNVEGKQDAVLVLITQLADKLNSGLKLPPLAATVRDGSLDQAKKVPFQATMLYSRALLAQRAGHTDDAVSLLQKSLVAYPDFTQAQEALKKLQPPGGTE